MREFLAGAGVEVSGVAEVEGAATGVALITVDAASQNAITVVPGANHRFDGGLGAMSIAPSDIVICQLEVPLAIVAAAFAAARSARATTLLNPSPCQPLPPAIVSAADIIVLNEIELAQMLGQPVEAVADRELLASARSLLERGPRAAIVTLGAGGVLVVERDRPATRLAGIAVRAVDTTGAGDCFVGALAAELLRGGDLAAAAHFANRAAAISVTREGAASSIPTRAEVEAH
jgi:ribokinase